MAKLSDELLAMARIERVLEKLSESARGRVLEYLVDRHLRDDSLGKLIKEAAKQDPVPSCKHPGFAAGDGKR